MDAVSLDTAGSGYQVPTVDFDLPDDTNGVQATGHALCVETDCITDGTGDAGDHQWGPRGCAGFGVFVCSGRSDLRRHSVRPGAPGGTGATATATLMVQSVTVDTFGFGYTSAAVDISDGVGLGAGASATATVEIGTVSGVALTNPGSGYVTGGRDPQVHRPAAGAV